MHTQNILNGLVFHEESRHGTQNGLKNCIGDIKYHLVNFEHMCSNLPIGVYKGYKFKSGSCRLRICRR